MATVTTLGTAQAKAVTSLSFTYANGLVVSAGDWIIVALALDVLDSNTIVKFVDSSTTYEHTLFKQVSGVNTGNACAAIYLIRAPVDSASGDSISITWNTSQGSAATFYKATGLTKNAAVTETATAAVWANLYTTANPNYVGSYFPNMKAGTITSIDLYMYRVGSPGGVFTITMRDPADHSGAVFYEGLCSEISTTAGWVTFTGSYTLSGDRGLAFTVRYNGGDNSNKLLLGRCSPPNLEHCSLTIPFGSSAWTIDAINYATCIRNVVGANVYNPYGTSVVATGTGTTAASGSTGTLPANPALVIGVAGVEDAGNDITGVWASGAGYVSGNAQSVGTTGAGDASNITTYSAAMLTTSTAALNASLGSLDSIDWVAIALSLHEAAASGNTYNMAAVAAGVATTTTPDLTRVMNMAPAAAAAGLTPSADLARIITQAASANSVTVTGTPTLQSMVVLAALAAATGATSTADLLKMIGYQAAAGAVGATSTADLLRVIAQAVSANAATATSTPDLARAISHAVTAACVSVIGDVDLTVTVLIDLAAAITAAGATSTADLARVIAHAASAQAATATSTADLARIIDLTAAMMGAGLTADADLTVSGGLIHLAAAIAATTATGAADLSRLLMAVAAIAAVSGTSTADLAKLVNHTAIAAGVTVTPLADLARVIAQAVSANANAATSAADLLKVITIAAGANAGTTTPTADLARLVNLVASADAVGAVSLAELLVAGLLEIYRRRIPDAVRVGSRGVAE